MKFKNIFDGLSFQQKGYITLGSGFLLHFVLGTFYLWGSISTYITSYLQHNGQDYSKEDVGAVYPFTLLATNIAISYGPYLGNRFGYRLVILVCSIFLGGSVIISSFVITIFPLFVFLYGFVFGLLNGLLYMIPFNTCYLYFPRNKGLVSGTIASGLGFGSTAFIWIMYALVNPDNEQANVQIGSDKYFNQEVCNRLPYAIRILGVIQIIFASLSAIFHHRPSAQELEKQDQYIYEMSHGLNHIDNHSQPSKGDSQPAENHLQHADDHSQPLNKPFQPNDQQKTREYHEPPITDRLSQPREKLEINIIDLNEHSDLHTEDHHYNSYGDHQEINDDHHDQNPMNPKHSNANTDVLQNNPNPNQTNLKPSVASSADCKNLSTLINQEQYFEFYSIKDGMQTKFIYLSILLTLLFAAYGAMIIANYKVYGEYLGYDDDIISAAGTVGSVFNGISRFFWGSLMEKFTIQQIIYYNLTFQMIISFTFRWASDIQGLFFLYILLGYFVYGGWYSVMPTLIRRIYGKKIGTSIYGLTFIGFTLASFVQYFLVKKVQEAIGWGNMFWVFTGAQALAIMITCITNFHAKPSSMSYQNNNQNNFNVDKK